jgi:CRP-like cAMP-binding protein
MQSQAGRPDDHHLVDLLSSIPFFKEASKTGLNHLLHFGLVRDFKPQQAVFDLEEDGDAMFFILDGEFNIVRDRKILATLNKGDFFGEMSLLTGEKRSARAEAKTAGTLLEIDRHAFRVLLESESSLMGQIENIFNQRALANKEAKDNTAKREEIKQTLLTRFKKLFGIV